ncbi:hypothetical protein SLS57_006726 [Botryosphaeria dothidea]
MPIDWKSQESYQRLLAALVAASDNNVDYKKVAFYFGQGATYDSIEGRFRIAKRMANTLKTEAEEEGRAMPTPRSKSTTTTPRKPKAKPGQLVVQSGRVQKSPSKKRGSAPKVKQEPQTPSATDSDDTQASQQQAGIDLDAYVDPYQHSFDTSIDPSIFSSYNDEEV